MLYLHMLCISVYSTQLTLHKYNGNRGKGAVQLSDAVQNYDVAAFIFLSIFLFEE